MSRWAWQPEVELPILLWKEALQVGVRRVVASRGRKPRFGYRPGDIWRNHLMGSLAEAVVHHYTGWTWPRGVNTFRGVADVGDYEVRWSGQSPPLLKVRSDEKPGTRIVLVTGDGEVEPFVIRGWATTEDAEDMGSWYEAPVAPCWFIHHSNLRHIDEVVDVPATA